MPVCRECDNIAQCYCTEGGEGNYGGRRWNGRRKTKTIEPHNDGRCVKYSPEKTVFFSAVFAGTEIEGRQTTA